MNPWFISGFIDGEGCFRIDLAKSSQYKTGWQVRLWFSICLHVKDIAILEKVQNYFGVGHVYKKGSLTAEFQCNTQKGLIKIFEHFDKFPLKTHKFADYQLLREAYYLMLKKE